MTKNCLKIGQKVVKSGWNGPKMVETGSKMVQKCFNNGSKLVQKCSKSVSKVVKNGLKMVQKG